MATRSSAIASACTVNGRSKRGNTSGHFGNLKRVSSRGRSNCASAKMRLSMRSVRVSSGKMAARNVRVLACNRNVPIAQAICACGTQSLSRWMGMASSTPRKVNGPAKLPSACAQCRWLLAGRLATARCNAQSRPPVLLSSHTSAHASTSSSANTTIPPPSNQRRQFTNPPQYSDAG